MRKITGVFAMSILLALAACGGGGAPTTKTYTNTNNGQSVTIPAGVSNLVLVSGQGAAGTPESMEYNQIYSDKVTIYNRRNDAGGFVTTLDGGTTYAFGPTPQDYCTPESNYTGSGGVVNQTWECHDFTDHSGYSTTPATTGAAATGFGKTFPGGVGGPATNTTFENVAVTPGQAHPLNIPAGASITITYYQ